MGTIVNIGGKFWVWPADGSAANGPDRPGQSSQKTQYRSIGALLLKRAPVSLNLHAGPSTSKNVCK
jgi:hypothetical protein